VVFTADRSFCSREIVLASRGVRYESPVPNDKRQAGRHHQIERERPGEKRHLRPVKPSLQSQRRNDDDCPCCRQLKDGTAPRIEIDWARLTHRCSQGPVEDRHREQCEAQNVMRCRERRNTRRQHPKTQHAAGHRDDIDERLRLAAARPFHRDEPQRYCIKDGGAGHGVEILRANHA